jgi:hypothetical protein
LPDTSVSADLLSDLIEGRSYAYGQASAEGDLARLARACRELPVAEPSNEAARRLNAKLEALLSRPQWRWWEGWYGPATRPLAQRMAAGALLMAAAGGGTSAATGVPPHELVIDAASLARSVVVNLAPSGSGGSGSPTETPASPTPGTPAPTAVTTPTPEPSPTAQPTQGAIATPDPEPEDDDNETRTPEPGDDNGGDDDNDDTPEAGDDDDDNSGPGGGS